MGLPSSVSFRTSNIDPTSLIPAASRQPEASEDSSRFERHLDESRSRDDRKVDRREDRRHRDRTESARDARKADGDNGKQKDTAEAGDDAAPVAALVEAPIAPVSDVKTPKTDAVAKTGETEATPELNAGELLKTDKAGEAKPEIAEQDTPVVAPKIPDATASKTDEKNPKETDKTVAADSLLPTPVTGHAAAQKADIQTPKVEVKSDVASAAAPITAAQTSLVAAAANAETEADAQQAPADATDPDSGLAIKGKEGLGHEAAASMADKSEAKNTGAQQAAPNTQAPAAQTAAAPTNFAKTLAAATGGEVTSVTATGGEGGTARLSDLQNVGNGTQNQNANTATVRIGTLPGQTTPTQVPAMAIALQVARNLQKGVNRFDIRLDPAEMGRIDVRMEVKKDGNVAAHLTVDRPETLDLLQRDSRALQQALNDAGLQANADSLNFSLRDQNAGGNAPSFGASAAGTSSSGEAAAPEEAVVSPIYNINLSATGGIDIRV
jgi:flagellar hook-length control protein FliK